MTTTKTVTLYSLAELKAAHPEGYAKVLARWRRYDGDCPWTDETMESLKAVVSACGGTMGRWEIGPDDGWLSVECEDIDDETGEPKDAAWLRRSVLKPNGYTQKNGHAYFPGLCKWTGYCADDAMIEAVYKAMLDGESLREALEGLASVASREMRDNLEQWLSEESMECNWNYLQFLADGTEWRHG